jgi:hypothetical protein
MTLENSITDIFTEFDDTIFSDGSIDPMGLRIIWTSLGNKIFQSKLNTISTDIRFYTLNLFHHSVINQCEFDFPVKIANLVSRPPYNNRQDLQDGIIIFLESLLTHAIVKNENRPEYSSVPGSSKLRGLMNSKPSDKRVTHLFVDRKEGILVRHILLGIHGRHKGPFLQIGIFHRNNYYQDQSIWEEASSLFSKTLWKSLADDLSNIINTRILSAKHSAASPLKMKVSDVLTPMLVKKYQDVLRIDNFRKQPLVEFWEGQLGLKNSVAGILYDELIRSDDKLSYEQIIKRSCNKGTADENKYIQAICYIEPLLTCIEKVINRLLKRGTSWIDKDLVDFMSNWLLNDNINSNDIQKYLSGQFLDKVALSRLQRLVEIYFECREKNDPELFIRRIIDFHCALMNTRNNLPWLSLGKTKSITQHRSFIYTEEYLKFLTTNGWVNSYYLPTVRSLHKGLYAI